MEQKLSGSHKALVEMQDVVAELLKTVPREYPATKVSGRQGEQGSVQHLSRCPSSGCSCWDLAGSPSMERLLLLPFICGPGGLGEVFKNNSVLYLKSNTNSLNLKKRTSREHGDRCRNKVKSTPGPWGLFRELERWQLFP